MATVDTAATLAPGSKPRAHQGAATGSPSPEVDRPPGLPEGPPRAPRTSPRACSPSWCAQAALDDLRAPLGALDSGSAHSVRPEERRDAPTDDERKRTAVADELRRRGLPVPRMPLGA